MISAQEALEHLREGNRRFVADLGLRKGTLPLFVIVLLCPLSVSTWVGEAQFAGSWLPYESPGIRHRISQMAKFMR